MYFQHFVFQKTFLIWKQIIYTILQFHKGHKIYSYMYVSQNLQQKEILQIELKA